MSQPDYVNHVLNSSQSKQSFSFTKSPRFTPKAQSSNARIYTLPSMLNKRACGFGYGKKMSLVSRSRSPSPDAYKIQSGDMSKSRNHTISFSKGRDEIKFNSFAMEPIKYKFNPSPNSYSIKQRHDAKGGRMAAKLPTELDLKHKNVVPGPGTYSHEIYEMRKSGSFILSQYRNSKSPKFYDSPNKQTKVEGWKKIGPGDYNIKTNDFTKSILSRFTDSAKRSFTKSKRQGPADNSKKGFPGFKYRYFSQFGNNT